MSRHRNIRSMNYSEEYDSYDEVYGHSVEDDGPLSPSDAAFMFDRSISGPQLSSFIKDDDDIAEEDEQQSFIKDETITIKDLLSELDKAKLASCLESIRNVLGDTVPEPVLVNVIIAENFDEKSALDKVLNQIEAQKTRANAIKKPKRVTPICTGRAQPYQEASSPIITVASSPAKNNVIKGFVVDTNKLDINKGGCNNNSRSSSPNVGQAATSKAGKPKIPPTRRDNPKAEEQFKQQRGDCKEQLHMVITGHVDAGKSTLMGHLLYKIGQVSTKTMHKYEQDSKKLGKQSFAYAWILDETGEERSRGITMDIGHSKFETPTKIVTLLDAPGHKDFIPNMITGVSQADVALLVVDATRGEFETGFESGGQTREHALLVRSLGVNQLCVVINKLDTVDWREERFQEISSKLGAFLKQAGFKERDISFVPCSGLTGENLIEKSLKEDLLRWYNGPSLIEVIDNFKSPTRAVVKPLRISVNDIFKTTGSGFCISGRIETGMIQIGDKVSIFPQNELATVKAITIDEIPSQSAFAGENVDLTITNYDQQNISVGYIICDPKQPVPISSKFEARIVVFNTLVPITRGYPVILHIQCLSEQAVITKLKSQLNKSTGDVIKRRPKCLLKNNNAIVVIETAKPICLELYRDMKELGRFLLRVDGITIAAGLITQIL